MSNNKPTIAFGRYPCCNAVRPSSIPEPAHSPVLEQCPSCGTRISRAFNGSVHVISLREDPRLYRNDTRLTFKTAHLKAQTGPVPLA